MTCGGDAVVKGQVLVFPRGDMGNVRVPLSKGAKLGGFRGKN